MPSDAYDRQRDIENEGQRAAIYYQRLDEQEARRTGGPPSRRKPRRSTPADKLARIRAILEED